MFFFNIFATIAFFVVQMWTCSGEDVQYAYKVISDTRLDWFAQSLATAAHQRLVIGAPRESYILTEPGIKIRKPLGSRFGEYLDVNQRFIAVSGWNPHSAYVYSSTRPYTLLVRIPVDDEVMDVKILNENTIIVATGGLYGYISVYGYTHRSSWERQQRIALEDDVDETSISLAVSGDMLAVGYDDGHHGRVKIYKKVNDDYTMTTILQPPFPVDGFGVSVAIEGRQLVVSSRKEYDNILFTYELDPSGGKWVVSGRLFVPGGFLSTYVSLQNNVLAATVTDPEVNPEVCAYVYKLSTNSHTTSNTNNSLSNDTEFTWKKVATLKTNGAAINYPQYHKAISVQEGLIFTGRWDYLGRDYGVVFVHDMNKE